MGSHTSETRVAMDALRRLVQVRRTSASADQKDHGISGAQLLVLQQLTDGKPCSMGGLADRTATHQSSGAPA